MMVTSLLSRVTGKKFVGIAAGGNNDDNKSAGGRLAAFTLS